MKFFDLTNLLKSYLILAYLLSNLLKNYFIVIYSINIYKQKTYKKF